MGVRKIILVTGATSGIGRETALRLARIGHRVIATGRRVQALEELDREAAAMALETFRLDLNDPESIEAAEREVDGRTDGYGLDVLVNNAGFGMMAPMELISGEDLRSQFETNVFGLVALTQRFLPAMRKRGSGRIINVSSVVGRFTLPFQGGYCATKAALESLSNSLRLEVAPFGVHVSVVEPGTIKTAFETTVESTVDKYQALESPYPAAVKRYLKVVGLAYRTAPGPGGIARTIEKIIRSPRPRALYVSPRVYSVGIFFSHLLPRRWLDWLMRTFTGLRRKYLSP